MVTVLWARHGQNVANLTETFSHRVFDGDLTDLGREQAQQLAGRLASREGDAIGYLACSPLRRARQTADIVAARLRLPVSAELDDLRELNVGELDGRSDTQAWDSYHQVLAAWRAGHTQVRFPAGEDAAELCGRLQRALSLVALSCRGSIALVVAHGASLRAAIPGLTGLPDPGSDIPTGAVADLRVEPSRNERPVMELLSWPGAGVG